eukprot:TRINITY_DN1613_c0_g1_i1.p1 TRINITY_DN1613_c0_g1~~TRINITY_DN1613_c0_g1_i1.p1  ORF type:complete len:1150 (+),score=239.88 TRINITY_DN1613_c0_g1_i1:98-3547(+)
MTTQQATPVTLTTPVPSVPSAPSVSSAPTAPSAPSHPQPSIIPTASIVSTTPVMAGPPMGPPVPNAIPTSTSFQAPPRTHSAPPNLAEQQQQIPPHAIYYPEKTNNFAPNYPMSNMPPYYAPPLYGMVPGPYHVPMNMHAQMHQIHTMQLPIPSRTTIPLQKTPTPQPKRVLIIKDPNTGVEYDPHQLLNAPSKSKVAAAAAAAAAASTISSSDASAPAIDTSPLKQETPSLDSLVDSKKEEQQADKSDVPTNSLETIPSAEDGSSSEKHQPELQQLEIQQSELPEQPEKQSLKDQPEKEVAVQLDSSEPAKSKTEAIKESETVDVSGHNGDGQLVSSEPHPEIETESVSQHPISEDIKEEEEDDWERKAEDELLNLEPGKESSDQKANPGDISSVAALSMIPVEFPEGSWKPPTSEKRIYDRSFLLGFQPVCTERPEGLPSMEAILGRDDAEITRESPRSGLRQMSFPSGNRGGGAAGRIGPPGLFRFGSDQQLGGRGPPGLGGPHRGGRDFHSPLDRGGIGGRGSYSQMRRSGEHLGKKQHQLNMGKQAPSHGPPSLGNRWERPRSSGDSEKDRVELILRKARSLLNKLTLEKFDSLSNQLLNIGINNVDVLRGLIGLVFEKALAEPHFSGMYADLCVKMSEKSLEFVDPNAANTEQKQTFRRILLNRCQEEFEVKPQPPPPDATDLEKEEFEFKRKRKMLGNIKFIGELYKRKMLTEMIMHQCIKLLLSGDIKNPSPDNIESLCVLMKKIGKIIDHSKAEPYMKEYFQRIKELSTNKNLESRIRFMLEDVIELRANKWVPRRKDDNPKTIKEIHREAEEKDLMSSAAASAILNQRSGQQRPTARSNSEKGFTGSMGRNNIRGSSSNVSLSSPIKEVRASNDSLVLGPMGNSMGSGAKGWNSTKALTENDGRSSSNNKQLEQTKRQEPVSRNEKEDRALPLETFEGLLDETLQEYLMNHDTQDAALSVSELAEKSVINDNASSAIVNRTVQTAFDCKPADFNLLLSLLCMLHQKNCLSSDALVSGLKQVMGGFEDILIDYPKAPQMIGKIVAHLIRESCLELPSLKDIMLPISSQTSEASSVLYEILLSLKESKTSEEEIRKSAAGWGSISNIETVVSAVCKSSKKDEISSAVASLLKTMWRSNEGV